MGEAAWPHFWLPVPLRASQKGDSLRPQPGNAFQTTRRLMSNGGILGAVPTTELDFDLLIQPDLDNRHSEGSSWLRLSQHHSLAHSIP
jgi:hypothetical protein